MRTHTKIGIITAYGFACGYVQRWGDVCMYKKSNAYHIRSLHTSDVFDRLSDAKAEFKKQIQINHLNQ